MEGKFYTWTPEEMTAALGVNRARIARKYFGVTERGRLEGRSVLHLALEPAVLARNGNASLSEMLALLEDMRQDLFNEREQRIKPGRDEKILTNWNGLMMRCFAEAGATFGRRDYVEAAASCARFLQDNLSDGDGVFHTWKDNQAKVAGFLEDYSVLIEGLQSLHEATLERRWLEWAQSLARVTVDRFWDSAGNQFVDVRLDQPVFLMRPRSVYDGATPSGASAATFACLRLSSITKEARYEAVAMSALRSQASVIGERPLGSGYWLSALDFHLGPVRQVAIVGPPLDPRTEELVGVVFERYRPNHVLVGSDPTEVSLPGTAALLQDKNMTDGLPTAFVCEGFRCGKPASSTAALRRLL